MERRRQRRSSRRFQVAFRERGTDARHVGFTTNISTSGMFIATGRTLPEGTRLRVEIGSGERGFVVEAIVAHSMRVEQRFRAVRQAGMGVRFLSVAELVAELAPESSRLVVEEAAGPRRQAPPSDGVYRVIYADRQQLMSALESDVQNGWLYVPSQTPAEVGDTVDVAITVRGHEGEALRLDAKVVERFGPTTGDDGQPNLLAGMGVRLKADDALQKVFGLLARIGEE